MFDFGLTHIALPVSDLDASIAFYAKYARMQVVHRRTDHSTGSDVVWISDRTRPFVIVLIEAPTVENPLTFGASWRGVCQPRRSPPFVRPSGS